MGGRGSNSGMMKTVNGKTVKRFNTPPPKGWNPVENALTNPKGYTWYSNGKSRFSGQYETALVKNKK